MDHKQTIVLLEQAKNELDKAIADLKKGFDSGALFALDDVLTCVNTAQEDIKDVR